MMQIAMKVTHADGSEAEVTAKASDLIAFERHFDKSMSVFGDPNNTRIEYVMWLAWHTTKKAKGTDLEFEPWVDSIDQITVGDSGESSR